MEEGASNAFCCREHARARKLAQTGINGLEERSRELNPNFAYVGEGKLWVEHPEGQANPDFILQGTNILVELYGNYWYDEGEVTARYQCLKDAGFKTHIIWAHEMNENAEEVQARMQAVIKYLVPTDIATKPLICERCGNYHFEIPMPLDVGVTFFCVGCIEAIAGRSR